MSQPTTRRTARDTAVTIAVQVVMVVAALALMRWSIIRWDELDRQGREEFRTLELIFGWPGWVAILVMSLAAAVFTLAVRLPVRAGVRWGRALWALVPFVLLWHLDLYFPWAEWGFHRTYPFLTELLGFDRFTFLDDQGMRWVLAALLGAALGSSIGRAPSPPATEAPGDLTADSPSAHVPG
jgi:hypothetical protein